MALRSTYRPARSADADRQAFEIVVADGYHPCVLEARAGTPIRLVFHRRDDHECSDRVVFSEPRLVRHLAPQATTIVDLPPAATGPIRFTCGMGRYRGRIEIIPGSSGSDQESGHPRRRLLSESVVGLALIALAVVAILGTVVGAPLVAAFVALPIVVALLAAVVARPALAHGSRHR